MSYIDKSADEICPILTSFCPHLIRDLALVMPTFVANNEGNDCPPTYIHIKIVTAMKRVLQHHALIATLVTMVLLLAGFSASAQEPYNIYIAGVGVNSDNCSDLSNIPGVKKGKVSYDPDTNTLYLENATINGGDKPGIYSSRDNITCDVKGDVNVTSYKDDAIIFFEKAIISGGGKLTARSDDSYGICMLGDLTISNCTVYAEGKWGLAANEGNGTIGSLTIKNAIVTAVGKEASLCDFTNFTLDGCEIDTPNAVWDQSKKAVCDATGYIIANNQVVITPIHYLEIAGVLLIPANYKDLTAIPGFTGKGSYDPDTKTLTLENATIEATKTEIGGIWVKVPELTCVVTGDVSIFSTFAAMDFNNSNATIKGTGQLTLRTQRDCSLCVLASSLLIDGCTIYTEGTWGICGPSNGVSGETVTIKNAYVKAKGLEASISDLANFTLEGCEFTKPAGAVWNAEKHADAEGNVIKDEVVIKPTGGTAIDFVTPEQLPAEGAIYDMNGVLRSETLEELPTGVYIVGGQKVMHVQR